MAQPRLVVSRCLGFAPCRYDGSVIPDPVVDSLRQWVAFIPICPEVELDLGAPRPPVRLVYVGEETRLLQPATGRDLTEAMRAFAASFLVLRAWILRFEEPYLSAQTFFSPFPEELLSLRDSGKGEA